MTDRPLSEIIADFRALFLGDSSFAAIDRCNHHLSSAEIGTLLDAAALGAGHPELVIAHDHRVIELLEENNRLLERARVAERRANENAAALVSAVKTAGALAVMIDETKR